MGPGHLPFSGGLAEQNAAQLACFGHLAHIEEEHRKATKGGDG